MKITVTELLAKVREFHILCQNTINREEIKKLVKRPINHHINHTIRVPNSLACIRLTYSCQTWNLTERKRQRTNFAYINKLRKMIRGGLQRYDEENSFYYKISNEQLLGICRAETLLTSSENNKQIILCTLFDIPIQPSKKCLSNENK